MFLLFLDIHHHEGDGSGVGVDWVTLALGIVNIVVLIWTAMSNRRHDRAIKKMERDLSVRVYRDQKNYDRDTAICEAVIDRLEKLEDTLHRVSYDLEYEPIHDQHHTPLYEEIRDLKLQRAELGLLRHKLRSLKGGTPELRVNEVHEFLQAAINALVAAGIEYRRDEDGIDYNNLIAPVILKVVEAHQMTRKVTEYFRGRLREGW